VGAKERASRGALAGLGATVVLTGLREAWAKTGLVFETAPMQVVDRMEEVGLVGDLSPAGRRMLTACAHFAYGAGAGAGFGLLREETGTQAEEAAVGSALGVLAWGAGWSSWLPLTGVHRPPWSQRTPRVLLPVIDHAVFGAAWGLLNLALSGRGQA
jgi:hypothetical protein